MPSESPRLSLFRHIGWTRLSALILVTVIAVSLNLWVPSLLGQAVDDLIAGRLVDDAIWHTCGFLLLVVLAGSGMSKLMRYLPAQLVPHLSHRMRETVLSHLLHLDDEQMQRRRVGDLMAKINSDIPAVSEMIAHGGHSLLRASLALGIAFTVMFRESVPLALTLAVILPALIAAGFFLLHGIMTRYTGVQEQFSVISNFCQESFLGIRLIKGMGIEPVRQKRFEQLNREYIKLNLHLSKIEIPAWPTMQFGFVLANILVLYVGGIQVLDHKLTLGTLVQFQQYLMVLQWPTLSLAWTMSLILRGRASINRVQETLSDVPTLLDRPETMTELTDLSGDISFDHVSLELGGRQILNDINLIIPKGVTLGITGPSGSGKTMLCHLLLRRFDPDSGRIRFGEAELNRVPLHLLRRKIRLAPQEPLLFSTSLRENLRYGDPDADQRRLDWALDVAAIREEVDDWKDGLDSVIGERGLTLSGGQRQRCGIARAILGDPEVLILDDCLSAVDTRTEARILKQLVPVMQEHTSIVVSHRYSALKHCDHILVLQDGKIDQQGAPADLLTASGYFSELAERQRLEAQLEALGGQ